MSFIRHIGIKRRSGRYPWGSGEDPNQSGDDFTSFDKSLRRKGIPDKDIAKAMGISLKDLRAKRSNIRIEKRTADRAMAIRLRDKGLSLTAIGERMHRNESSIRALLNDTLNERASVTKATADLIREKINSKGYIDVGSGVESHLGITRTKLDNAVASLKAEGYKVYNIKKEQLGTGKNTTIRVIGPKDSTYGNLMRNYDKIHLLEERYSETERTFLGLLPIQHLDSKRVYIRYHEDGGSEKDGVIELRPGVEGLSLGRSKYSQVRIGVDGSHYLKGMAMYADDVPAGYDVIYNTNKKKGTPKEKVFKELQKDPLDPTKIDLENPFGASIKRDGQKGYINALSEEGDWDEWSKSLSSQFLSKQSPALAKKQLDLAYKEREEELNDILSLTNPAVKKALLRPASDQFDADAEDLRGAALPGQRTHVILPIPSMKPTEIYAPNYQDGDRVVLIRHPHGGTFEIPELVVNNKNPKANKLLKQAEDAVGIHPDVAEKLSGADFDGDTVIVIPNKNREVKTSASLVALKGFNPKELYKNDALPEMKDKTKQLQMGVVSNLITDMTIRGASQDEIARAVRHSMVVIDAQKHHLDWKQSEIDHGIEALRQKYQLQDNGHVGASTIISRASSEAHVKERSDYYKTDPLTGKKIFRETGRTYNPVKKNDDGTYSVRTKKRTGEVIVKDKQTKTTKMALVDDAFSLSSGTKIESIYAEHANKLKALANKARLALLNTPSIVYSPEARRRYSEEVRSLKEKLSQAYRNRPLERQAQLIANKIYETRLKANKNMSPDAKKKIKSQALIEARSRMGALKQNIEITDREWEAIQMGAITNHALNEILMNTDLDSIKTRSMPRSSSVVSPAKESRAKALQANGLTAAQIAAAIGVSTSTVKEILK